MSTVRRLLILLLPLLLVSRSSVAFADGCEVDDDVFVHGLRQGGLVALTFDACPTSHVPGFTPAIVDELKEAGVPATFFVSGRWAEAHPQDLRTLTSEPLFEIGLHGYRHHHLKGASPEAIEREIEDGRQALQSLGESPEALFRPPYGERPHALAEAARSAGVTPVLWDVAPGDPDPHETAAKLEHDVLQRVRAGSVIVLHVNGRGVGTAAALPALVRGIRQRGLRFVKASELIRACGATAAASN